MADNEPVPDAPPCRIACLIPSATAICIALGLSERIVGTTHECDRTTLPDSVRILTNDGLGAHELSQQEIHDQVAKQSQQQESISSSPWLYALVADEFQAAAPTVVLTQDLCKVCAPSSDSVKAILRLSTTSTEPDVVSLTPESINEIAESFCTVATACGVPERGQALRDDFLRHLKELQQAVEQSRDASRPQPRMFLLEWLDPPFDGGHWIPEMMEYAGVLAAAANVGKAKSTTKKSVVIPWTDVAKADADCLLVACCGFDLERNIQDTLNVRHRLEPLRAVQQGRLYASNGDAYFANPGPNLLIGSVIMALCAHEDQPQVTKAIMKLPFVPVDLRAWQKVNLLQNGPTLETKDPAELADIEDFYECHAKACQAGQKSYKDPTTGYNVFTELAHKDRGKCCGSGCRHCPYSHENVSDKTARIQQPAFLHVADDDSSSGIFAVRHGNVKVLFDSGGKDSFLTIRALARQAKKCPFGLVLLTTFDTTSRVIAHQDVSIDQVLRQAEHLGISLIAVPMHRGSSEGYVSRIRRALDVVEKRIALKISALVFGDLHLDNIRDWREDQLGPMGYELVYPLWKVDYQELAKDLEESKVPCVISATTHDGVAVGDVFDRSFMDRVAKLDVDLFGENGEFHSLAEVWRVDKDVALGC